MAETCEMQDKLVLNGMPGRAQALLNACCTLPPSLQKSRYFNRTVKLFIKTVSNYVNYTKSLLHLILSLKQ